MLASTEGNAAPALQVRGMACERGGKPLFTGIDFAVPAGGAVLLVGPNGSGKTTLLRALAGLTEPVAGEVLWHGEARAPRGAHWRMQIAYSGHKSGLKDDLDVAENFELACALDALSA